MGIYNEGRGGIAAGNVLWPIGIGLFITGDILFIDVINGVTEELPAALTCSGVGTGLFVTGLILKGVGKGRLNSLVDDYNSGRGNTLSLSVQPSLLRTYDMSYAPGVGIALRF